MICHILKPFWFVVPNFQDFYAFFISVKSIIPFKGPPPPNTMVTKPDLTFDSQYMQRGYGPGTGPGGPGLGPGRNGADPYQQHQYSLSNHNSPRHYPDLNPGHYPDINTGHYQDLNSGRPDFAGHSLRPMPSSSTLQVNHNMALASSSGAFFNVVQGVMRHPVDKLKSIWRPDASNSAARKLFQNRTLSVPGPDSQKQKIRVRSPSGQ